MPKEIEPIVYFRGINRIHVNRFKAYLHILSNRLDAQWEITQDIKMANVVIEPIINKPADNKNLHMSVLSDQANLKPPSIMAFNLSSDENKLVQQLNQASKRLSRGFQGNLSSERSFRRINVCGLLDESLNSLCDQFNQKTQDIRFVPCGELFSADNELYRKHLLLIVNAQLPLSMQAYQALVEKKTQGHIVIDELTIVIIKGQDEQANEDMFDTVYGNADDSTQVTLLNPEDETDLNSFVKFF